MSLETVAGVPASRARTGHLAAIGRLAAPLTGFFALQGAVGLGITAALGQVGDVALAGVGAAGTVSSMFLSTQNGFDTAVQATIARHTGADRRDAFGQALVDAWALSLPLGLALSVLLWLAAPAMLAFMAPNAAAAAVGAANLRAAAPSIALLSLTIPMNACWIGQGRPHLAFLVTAVQVPAQIVGTFVLVLGFGPIPAFGPSGAGAAWTLSSLIGVALQLALAARPGAIPGLGSARPRPGGVLTAAAIAWPISLQQTLLQMGLIVIYLIVARLGVSVVAATNVLVTLGNVPSLMAVGIGIAAATLVGQSLGRGDVAEARRWGWRSAALGVAVGAPIALVFLISPQWVLGLFLHDRATMAIAVWPLRIFGACLAAEMTLRVLSFALRGAGATLLGAGIPFAILWLVQLPLSWLVAVPLGFGLLGLASVQSGLTVVEAAVTALVWAGAFWTRRRIGSGT